MDSLQAITADDVAADAPPLLAAGLQEVISARSLWARMLYAIDEAKLTNRAVTALRAFRDILTGLADTARQEPVATVLGKMLDRTGYLNALRDENSEEANERIENLMELVSASQEYESREPDPSLGGFVDRLSLLSEADEESGNRERAGLDDDHARGQGPRVPDGGDRRARRGPVSPLAVGGGPRGAGGRTAPVLRRHDARPPAARPHRRRETAGVRRVSELRAVPLPRRGARAPHGSHRTASRAHATTATSRTATTSSAPIPTAGKAPPISRRRKRPTPTSTRTSPRPTSEPGCGCATRSSGSAR